MVCGGRKHSSDPEPVSAEALLHWVTGPTRDAEFPSVDAPPPAAAARDTPTPAAALGGRLRGSDEDRRRSVSSTRSRRCDGATPPAARIRPPPAAAGGPLAGLFRMVLLDSPVGQPAGAKTTAATNESSDPERATRAGGRYDQAAGGRRVGQAKGDKRDGLAQRPHTAMA